jgi:excisionase family DNA binding protein
VAQIRELNRILQGGPPALVGACGERLELPDTFFHLLQDIVRNMQLGRAIVLIPESQQLTTQRAADLLGVSRPHLIKLLEAGELRYRKAGGHRRIYLRDLIRPGAGSFVSKLHEQAEVITNAPTRPQPVRLPEDLATAGQLNPAYPSPDAARLLALELFREDKVSLDRAAELCQTPVEAFIEFAGRHQVPLHYGATDLEAGRATLQRFQ